MINSKMITSEKKPVEYQKQDVYNSIQFYPITDGSYLLLQLYQLSSQNSANGELQYRNADLVHHKETGEIIFQYRLIRKQSFHQSSIKLSMFSEREVIVANKQLNILTQINLKTHKVLYFTHKFNTKYKKINLHFFSETGMLCIVEDARHGLKLTYYHLPLVLAAKPIVIYRCEVKHHQFCWDKISKANNHSMIIWFNSIFQGKFNLHVFDLSVSAEGQYYKVVLQCSLDTVDINMYYKFNDGWEKKRGQFLFVGEYWLQVKKPKIIGTKNTLDDYQIQYRVMKLDIKNNSLSNTAININREHYQHIYECANFGQFSCINAITKSFGIKNKRVGFFIQSVFMHNQTERIIEIQRNQCSEGQINCIWPTHDPRSMFNLFFVKTNNTLIYKGFRHSTRFFSQQEVTLHYLLDINKDFDEYLLKDAVDLIDYDRRQPIQDKQKILNDIYYQQQLNRIINQEFQEDPSDSEGFRGQSSLSHINSDNDQ